MDRTLQCLPDRPVRSLLTEAMCAAQSATPATATATATAKATPVVTAGFDGARIHTVLPVSASSRL